MTYDLTEIKKILPHRDPFLFVDRVIEFLPGEKIVAEKCFNPDEWFFKGHFPGNPLMPGVLVSEGLAQASGLLLGLTWKMNEPGETEEKGALFLAGTNIKFLNPAIPGDTVRFESELKKEFGKMFLFEVAAFVADKRIAKGSLSLAAGNQRRA